MAGNLQNNVPNESLLFVGYFGYFVRVMERSVTQASVLKPWHEISRERTVEGAAGAQLMSHHACLL